jgi:hypothetical protein
VVAAAAFLAFADFLAFYGLGGMVIIWLEQGVEW